LHAEAALAPPQLLRRVRSRVPARLRLAYEEAGEPSTSRERAQLLG
jgi:hypothetical protein